MSASSNGMQLLRRAYDALGQIRYESIALPGIIIEIVEAMIEMVIVN